MPADCAPSPRAAIKNWLSTHDHEPERAADQSTLPNDHGIRDLSQKLQPKNHQSHRRSAVTGDKQHRHSRHPSARVKLKEPYANDGPEFSGPQTGLAEQLGLHAPFRTFGDRGEDSDYGTGARRQRRKRKYVLSSSSPLRPAGFGDEFGAKGSQIYEFHQHGLQSEEHQGLASPRDHPARAKTYERRLRHKTRADKYNEKQAPMKPAERRQEDGAVKKSKKRKRKEKSGNTLLHDFNATNVAQDRLTMKPTISLGLFGKGRASSPVRRKGLPDLTFSEVNFLKSRRAEPEAPKQRSADETKRQKRDKVADKEAEISRYFTTRAPTIHVEKELGTGGKTEDRSARPPTEPHSPLVTLPDRPFLGFGSSGATLTSPMKPGKCHDKIPRSSRSSINDRSYVGSTTYYSWSESDNSIAHPRTTIEEVRKRGSVQETTEASHSPPSTRQPNGVNVFRRESTILGEQSKDYAKAVDDRDSIERSGRQERSKAANDHTNSRGAESRLSKPQRPTPKTTTVAVTRKAAGSPLSQHLINGATAQKGPDIELDASLGKETTGSQLPCHDSHSFDATLEEILGNCQQGFESSKRTRFEQPIQNALPAVVATVRPVKHKDRVEGLQVLPEAEETHSRPRMTIPPQLSHACSQMSRPMTFQEPTYMSPTHLTIPHVVDASTSLPLNYMIARDSFQDIHVSKTNGGGAWNAYRSLYEAQMTDIPDGSPELDHELPYADDWGGEPVQAPQSPGPRLSDSGVVDSCQGSFDDRFEENKPQHCKDEVLGLTTAYQQPAPYEAELYLFDRPQLETLGEWSILRNVAGSQTGAHALQTRSYVDSLATPLSFDSNLRGAAIPRKSFQGDQTRVFGADYFSIDEDNYDLEDGYRDTELMDTHLMNDEGDRPLTDFWKPNRLY